MSQSDGSSSDGGDGGDGGGIFKTVLILFAAIVAGVIGLKVAAWALKVIIWAGVIGALGYGGYRLFQSALLEGDKDQRPKALPPGEPDPELRLPAPRPVDPVQAAADVDAELEELKRRMKREDP